MHWEIFVGVMGEKLRFTNNTSIEDSEGSPGAPKLQVNPTLPSWPTTALIAMML
jgi:hypothetical protein